MNKGFTLIELIIVVAIIAIIATIAISELKEEKPISLKLESCRMGEFVEIDTVLYKISAREGNIFTLKDVNGVLKWASKDTIIGYKKKGSE